MIKHLHAFFAISFVVLHASITLKPVVKKKPHRTQVTQVTIQDTKQCLRKLYNVHGMRMYFVHVHDIMT
jgi:hypothetical protein